MNVRHTVTLILVAALMSGTHVAADSLGCAPGLAARSSDQVMNDHFAALLSGDLDLILCDYSPDAAVVAPGSVISGPDEIRAFYAQIFSQMGGPATLGLVSLTFSPINPSRSIVLLEWNLDSPHLEVGDGTDSFLIVNGKIQQHTIKLAGVMVK